MFEDPLEKEEEKTVPHHIDDSEARDLLRKLCSDSNICAIQTFQRKERNSILESALRRGLGVRQLARLTGVSYGIIQRSNEKVGQRTASPDPLSFTVTSFLNVYRAIVLTFEGLII